MSVDWPGPCCIVSNSYVHFSGQHVLFGDSVLAEILIVPVLPYMKFVFLGVFFLGVLSYIPSCIVPLGPFCVLDGCQGRSGVVGVISFFSVGPAPSLYLLLSLDESLRVHV